MNGDEWKYTQYLGFVNESDAEWIGLINTLKSNFITLEDNELDKLIWTKIAQQVIIYRNWGMRFKLSNPSSEKKNGGGILSGKL